MPNTAPKLETEKLNKAITKSIESGQYFDDAIDWYFHRFLLPIAQRSIMTVICVLTLIAFIPIGLSFNYLFPLSHSVPFIIWSKYTDEKYPELNKLGENLDNAEEMFAQHFLTNYVRDREEYYPTARDLNRQRRSRIKAQSSRRVNREYDSFINLKNKKSPINLYGSHSGRYIDNIKVQFPKGQEKLHKAIVTFTSEVKRINRNIPTKTAKWQAEIKFRFTDIDLILTRKKDLRLLVQSYTVKQVFR